jgi:hypothetical protein
MKSILLCATALAVCQPAFALSVTPAGFFDDAGQPIVIRGLNANVQDAPRIFNNLQQWFPGMTMLRLNCNVGHDSASDIANIVSTYTGAGIIVEVEDHSSNTSNNVAWYAQMAGMFKSNPLVTMETANEPAESNVAEVQINMIRAIRGAGFTNPIGLQPANGYDTSTYPAVLGAVGTTNMYVTPHIYYNANDPNGAAGYVASEIADAQRNGVFPVIDEFGDSIDGPTPDPMGHSTIQAAIDANEAGKAGATYWEAWNDNGYMAEPDAVCFTIDCGQLTDNGASYMRLWLGKRDPSQLTQNTVGPVLAPIQAQIDAVQQQVVAAQKVADNATAASSSQSSPGTPQSSVGTKLSQPITPPNGPAAPGPNPGPPNPLEPQPPSATSQPAPTASTPTPPPVQDMQAAMEAELAAIKEKEAEIGQLLAQIAAMQAATPQVALPPVPAPPVAMTVPVPTSQPVPTDPTSAINPPPKMIALPTPDMNTLALPPVQSAATPGPGVSTGNGGGGDSDGDDGGGNGE